MMRKVFIFLFVSKLTLCVSQPVALDSTFAINGMSHLTPITKAYKYSSFIYLATSGKIYGSMNTLQGLYCKPNLYRLKSFGMRDPSFGPNGFQSPSTFGMSNYSVNHISEWINGEVIGVCSNESNGSNPVYLFNYDSLGTRLGYKSYSLTGYQRAFGLHVESTNNILVPLKSNDRLFVSSFLLNGGNFVSRTTYGSNGVWISPNLQNNGNAVSIITPTNRLIIGSSRTNGPESPMRTPILFVLKASGELDTLVNGTGRIEITSDHANELIKIAVQSDGKIAVLGKRGNQTRVFRLSQQGNLDQSFGFFIADSTDEFHDLILQPDGKVLLIGGTQNSVCLVRLMQNGQIDSTFNGIGKVITPIPNHNYSGYKGVLQPDGKLIVSCMATISQSDIREIMILRYTIGSTIGKVELKLNVGDVVVYPNPFSNHATLQFSLLKDSKLTISLINMLGVKVADLANKTQFMAGENEIILNGYSDLPNGQYFVVISSSNGNVSIPIVKGEAR